VDLYNGFNGLRHRINWTYFSVLDGLAHPLYSDIKQCPFCESNDFTKYGHKKDGTQRYICKECGKRFTALTNTIFDSKKNSYFRMD